MPSVALLVWNTDRQSALDEMETAHESVGGFRRGRRYATQQINQAYCLLLSSQFQGFCRDLHSEAAEHFVKRVPAGILRKSIRDNLVENRLLDRRNPNPGNIGVDYNKFGFTFWKEVLKLDMRNERRRDRLDELNRWRNAIAHQDLTIQNVAALRLRQVREWRRICNHLATYFDETIRVHISTINGVTPW